MTAIIAFAFSRVPVLSCSVSIDLPERKHHLTCAEKNVPGRKHLSQRIIVLTRCYWVEELRRSH